MILGCSFIDHDDDLMSVYLLKLVTWYTLNMYLIVCQYYHNKTVLKTEKKRRCYLLMSLGRAGKLCHQTWLDLGLKYGHQALMTLFLCVSFILGPLAGRWSPVAPEHQREGASLLSNTREQVSFAQPSTDKGVEHVDWLGLGPVPTPLKEHGPKVGEIAL